MNYSHGGEVKKLDKREDGVFEIDIQPSKLFKNLGMAKLRVEPSPKKSSKP